MTDENKNGEVEQQEFIVQLPIEVIIDIATSGISFLPALKKEWAVVYTDGDLTKVQSFSERDETASWLAKQYDNQDSIVAILHLGKPKKFEIKVDAKISMR